MEMSRNSPKKVAPIVSFFMQNWNCYAFISLNFFRNQLNPVDLDRDLNNHRSQQFLHFSTFEFLEKLTNTAVFRVLSKAGFILAVLVNKNCEQDWLYLTSGHTRHNIQQILVCHSFTMGILISLYLHATADQQNRMPVNEHNDSQLKLATFSSANNCHYLSPRKVCQYCYEIYQQTVMCARNFRCTSPYRTRQPCNENYCHFCITQLLFKIEKQSKLDKDLNCLYMFIEGREKANSF